VIVLSMVRSNASGVLGHVIDRRRVNVAFTRARSELYVVGDAITLAQGKESGLGCWVSMMCKSKQVVLPPMAEIQGSTHALGCRDDIVPVSEYRQVTGLEELEVASGQALRSDVAPGQASVETNDAWDLLYIPSGSCLFSRWSL